MAIRTTAEAIILIMPDYDDDISLDPFIEVANNIVEQVCLESGYSDATLELIERWLGAHFYTVREQLAHSETAGKVSVTYEGRTYTGFRYTRYGQQAMLIDTAGNLKILDDNKKYKIQGGIWYIGGERFCGSVSAAESESGSS